MVRKSNPSQIANKRGSCHHRSRSGWHIKYGLNKEIGSLMFSCFPFICSTIHEGGRCGTTIQLNPGRPSTGWLKKANLFLRFLKGGVLYCRPNFYLLQLIPSTYPRLTSLLNFRVMENVQGVHGAEGGSDPEFHDIPTHPLNATNSFELPNNVRPELPLLLRVKKMENHCQ